MWKAYKQGRHKTRWRVAGHGGGGAASTRGEGELQLYVNPGNISALLAGYPLSYLYNKNKSKIL